MKIFISWSGSPSRQVAEALKDWLPRVIQSLRPYVSSEDIGKGTRWSNDISGELASSQVGIVCVTQNSRDAVWTHFEAGALYKALDSTRVIPFLFRVSSPDLSEPLRQFQYAVYDRDDVQRMVASINKLTEHPLADQSLVETFEVWWPKLQGVLDLIPDPATQQDFVDSLQKQDDLKPVLEELLDLARDQQRRLSGFPPLTASDVVAIVNGIKVPVVSPRYFRELEHDIRSLRRMVDSSLASGINELPVDILRDRISRVESSFDRMRPLARRLSDGPDKSPDTALLGTGVRHVVSDPVSHGEQRRGRILVAESDLPADKREDAIEDVPWDDGEPPF